MDHHAFTASPPVPRLSSTTHSSGHEPHRPAYPHYYSAYDAPAHTSAYMVPSPTELLKPITGHHMHDPRRDCPEVWMGGRDSESSSPYHQAMTTTGHPSEPYHNNQVMMHQSYRNMPHPDRDVVVATSLTSLKRHGSDTSLTSLDSYNSHNPHGWLPSTSPPSSTLSSPSSPTPQYALDFSKSSMNACFADPHLGLASKYQDHLVPPPPTVNGKRSHSHRVHPGYTKKPPNAFLRFRTYFIEQNSSLPESHPARLHDSRAISSAAGLVWRRLSNEVKKPWNDEAKWAMLEFKRAHPELLLLESKPRPPKRIRQKRAHTAVDVAAAEHAALVVLPSLTGCSDPTSLSLSNATSPTSSQSESTPQSHNTLSHTNRQVQVEKGYKPIALPSLPPVPSRVPLPPLHHHQHHQAPFPKLEDDHTAYRHTSTSSSSWQPSQHHLSTPSSSSSLQSLSSNTPVGYWQY